ncbi:MAG TPA: diguanylate cyclase [Clostridiaceae bacterium]|nr:diguanylate cyclase [Clostridiaceae bacterium]
MIKEIHIIDCNNDLIMTLRELFEEERTFRFRNINPDKLELSLKSIPSLIIINEESINEDVLELCEKIRKNEDNSITPIIVITADDSEEHKIDILERSVEYVISKKEIKDYLYYIIKNLSRLLTVNRTVSPLTGLPGNLPIQTELKKRLLKKEPFVVLYIDLDNFKAYNDVYGFLKGDEIIKLTAKIITKHIHALESTDAFVGHIGGDDFVAITNDDIDYEAICQDIIAEFDVEVLKLFNDTDIERKYIEVQNRKGVMEQFPLTSISIGVVVADAKRFSNILEIGEVGAQVKHLSKTTMGSSYAIDRREEND